MEKILKYLTIIPGAAGLLFSVYIMGIAQDFNATDFASTAIKMVLYFVSLIFVFLSISTILYALSVINDEDKEKSKKLEEISKRTYSKIYEIADIFGLILWTTFVVVITIVGWKSIKGDILIVMCMFWLSAIYALYKLIRKFTKKRSN